MKTYEMQLMHRKQCLESLCLETQYVGGHVSPLSCYNYSLAHSIPEIRCNMLKRAAWLYLPTDLCRSDKRSLPLCRTEHTRI